MYSFDDVLLSKPNQGIATFVQTARSCTEAMKVSSPRIVENVLPDNLLSMYVFMYVCMYVCRTFYSTSQVTSLNY